MCLAMYEGCLVGEAWRWCFVDDVGNWYRLESGFGRLVGYIECLLF